MADAVCRVCEGLGLVYSEHTGDACVSCATAAEAAWRWSEEMFTIHYRDTGRECRQIVRTVMDVSLFIQHMARLRDVVLLGVERGEAETPDPCRKTGAG